jgi:hypothetical protein
MWYAGWDASWNNGMGHATSVDGINWEKDWMHNPVFSPDPGTFYSDKILPNSMIYLNNEYQLWFSGSISGPDFYRIGYATSTDGLQWTVQNFSLPVLYPGDTGDWDEIIRFNCVVLHYCSDNNFCFETWYTGVDEDNFIRIGLAYGDTIVVTDFPDKKVTTSKSIITSPNPFTTITTLEYELFRSSDVQINLYNQIGEKVLDFLNKHQTKGKYEHKINGNDLKPGVYFCTLKTNKVIHTKKLIKVD